MELKQYLLLVVMLMPNAPFHNLIYLITQALETGMMVSGPFFQTGEALTGRLTVLESDFSKQLRHPVWKDS